MHIKHKRDAGTTRGPENYKIIRKKKKKKGKAGGKKKERQVFMSARISYH
jgi:hypothetical protein